MVLQRESNSRTTNLSSYPLPGELLSTIQLLMRGNSTNLPVPMLNREISEFTDKTSVPKTNENSLPFTIKNIQELKLHLKRVNCYFKYFERIRSNTFNTRSELEQRPAFKQLEHFANECRGLVEEVLGGSFLTGLEVFNFHAFKLRHLKNDKSYI